MDNYSPGDRWTNRRLDLPGPDLTRREAPDFGFAHIDFKIP